LRIVRVVRAAFAGSAAGPEGYPKADLPEVALAGRSNVGKSTLINALLNRKGLAKTSSTPGKTRLINFFDVDGRFHLVDLPGYGFARVPRGEKAAWRHRIEGYITGRKVLRLVVLLLDIRHPPTACPGRAATGAGPRWSGPRASPRSSPSTSTPSCAPCRPAATWSA